MLRMNGPAALHRHGRLWFGKDCRVRPARPATGGCRARRVRHPCDLASMSASIRPSWPASRTWASWCRSWPSAQQRELSESVSPTAAPSERSKPDGQPSQCWSSQTRAQIAGLRVERIVAQYVENTQRAGLTQSEEVSVVATLFDLGLSAAQALATDLSTPHLPSPRTGWSPSPCARSVAADRPASMAAKDSDTDGHDRQMVDGKTMPNSASASWKST